MSWWEIVIITLSALVLCICFALSAYGEYKRHKAYMLERAEQTKLYRELLIALRKHM